MYNFNMVSPPLITVVIATYNRSNVLPYSIGSALNQSCSNIEVLVIGDGCTDDSQSVVESINDPRVRWIGLSENSGHQSGPNNVGMKEARGEFIAYLGHDDVWLPHHLQACVERLNQGADLSYALIMMIKENKAKYLWPAKGHYRPGLWIPPSGMVHRKSVTDNIGGWKHYTQIQGAPDTDLWRRAHEAGYKFAFVPRLSAIKIPAACRKNVYKTRNFDEQSHWFKRTQSEPDLESTELALCYIGLHNQVLPQVASMPYRKLLRYFLRETLHNTNIVSRFRRRGQKKQCQIEKNREYKGLTPKPE